MLYKFRSELNSASRSILRDSTLWFATFSSLNDKFEYEMVIEKKTTLPWAVSRIRDVLGLPEEQAKEMALAAIQDGRLNFDKGTIETRLKIMDLSKVLCLSSTWDDERMWAYYGGSGKGFALGFEFPDGPRSFDPPANAGSGVGYYERPIPLRLGPSGFPMEAMLLLFLKRNDWKHEREYRFVKLPEEGSATGGCAAKFPPECLREVLVRESASDQLIKELKELTKVPIIRVAPNLSTYRLERQGPL